MLIDKLPACDKRMITTYIQDYGISNREYNGFPYTAMAPLTDILRAWNTNKQEYLWKLFGEQFILEREVVYQRPDDVLAKQFNDALNDSKMGRFKNRLWDKVEQYYDYFSDGHRRIRRLFDFDNLKDNRYSGSSFTIYFGDDFKYVVLPGAKIMKVLNKIAKFFNMQEEFEAFRIEHSQILNQKLLKGTLCLSIHPLDFMTMSDNTYDWDSCMSWEHNGCYRAGTVEMMNSHCMVIAYLKGDKPFRIDEDMWEGNKKWRELIVVHPYAICNIKPYPYMNPVLTDMALEWLRELASVNLGWDVSYDAMEIDVDERFTYHDNRSYMFDFYTYRMYNDFGTSNTSHRIIIPQQNITEEESLSDYISRSIDLSGPNICMCCGSTFYPEEGHEDQVLCSNCDPGISCSSCGAGDYDDDNMYYVEGDMLCPDCYHELAGLCHIYEEHYYSENLVTLYLAPVDDMMDYYENYKSVTIHKDFIRVGCLNNTRGIFKRDTVRTVEMDGETLYYVNMDDCYNYALEDLFHLWSPWARDSYVRLYHRT